MKSLFEREALGEVTARIERLQPAAQRVWGKMDVAQMMAHCSATFEVASGRVVLPRMFIGRILGPFLKPHFSNEKPFAKNGPTHPTFVISNERDFASISITTCGNSGYNQSSQCDPTAAGWRIAETH